MLGKFYCRVVDQSNSLVSQFFVLLSSTCVPPPLHIRHPHPRLYIAQNCHVFEILNSKVKSKHILIYLQLPHTYSIFSLPFMSSFGPYSSAHPYLFPFYFMTNLSIISNTISPNPLTPILSVNLSHIPGKTSGWINSAVYSFLFYVQTDKAYQRKDRMHNLEGEWHEKFIEISSNPVFKIALQSQSFPYSQSHSSYMKSSQAFFLHCLLYHF